MRGRHNFTSISFGESLPRNQQKEMMAIRPTYQLSILKSQVISIRLSPHGGFEYIMFSRTHHVYAHQHSLIGQRAGVRSKITYSRSLIEPRQKRKTRIAGKIIYRPAGLIRQNRSHLSRHFRSRQEYSAYSSRGGKQNTIWAHNNRFLGEADQSQR